MMKKSLSLLILILIILLPTISLADGIKTIIIVVDELSINEVEELSLDKYCLGLLNLKTRSPYSEEGLYLSINTGRKLNLSEFGKKGNGIEYLGDVLKKEKVSYIGEGIQDLLVVGSNREVDYKEESMIYDLKWLIEKTDIMLNKSNVLELSYNFQGGKEKVDLLSSYLDNYKNNKIIILPKKVSKEDKNLLNQYIVPIIYIDGQNKGLLTSLSTNREGFISMEDISVHIKKMYGHTRKTNIGKEFQIIPENEPLNKIDDIYNNTMNLLIIAYIFHGIIYLAQGLLAIWILRKNKIKRKMYMVYIFGSLSICSSLILGFFQFHNNILLYLSIIIPITYIITKKLVKKDYDIVRHISISTYSLIAFGIILYPKMIYNSYIGFNNLVYGARYYGLNNGIMGVLLATSILSFFSITKGIKNINKKRFIGFSIFILNTIVLSARFGANTGGFITSIVLLGIMIYILFFNNKPSLKNIGLFVLIGIFIFVINMIFDNGSGEKSHAIQFFYRLKENGIEELISMISFKITELLKLTLLPPFSIVLIFQGIILKKLSPYFNKSKEIKKEAMIMIITSLVGFILNDTGVITLIYMMQYLIFATITRNLLNE